jgi:hypothetical protein
MIYILLALVIGVVAVAAFFAGVVVYRLGVNDGMKRLNGAYELDPLFTQPQPEPDDAEKRLSEAVENFGKGVKR